MFAVFQMRSRDWERWQRAYQKARERNFFISPHWGRVLFQAYHKPPVLYRFKFMEGEVMIPCFVDRRIRGIFHGLLSMPLWHYGGVLSEFPLTEKMETRIAERISREWRLHTLAISFPPGKKIAGWTPYESGTFSTHLLDISKGMTYLWDEVFDNKQRNSIRKAQRLGMEARIDKSLAAVETFYELYSKSNSRWQRSPYEPIQFFKELILPENSDVDLWMARNHEGTDVAAVIIANNGIDTAYYLYGASDESSWNECPNNLLLYESIARACKKGHRTFDFLPSGRISSVEKFKESFGARPVFATQYWLKGFMPSLKRSLKNKYARFF
jgi:hypothetical protein